MALLDTIHETIHTKREIPTTPILCWRPTYYGGLSTIISPAIIVQKLLRRNLGSTVKEREQLPSCASFHLCAS